MVKKILVITPVHHIAGICENLAKIGRVTYMDDPSMADVLDVVEEYDAIFTNPNKSKVFIGREVIDAGTKIKVICTASTGTNHIDRGYASQRGIQILSLTEERDIINRISSTAELAFGLMMAGLRNIVASHNDALDGGWDYTKYIGRQMNCLTIGVIGYGRLGKMYSSYCRAFGSRVIVYDPYKKIASSEFEQVDDLDLLLLESDVISIHVHVNEETKGMIDKYVLRKMKKDVLLVNSARGDIINEPDVVDFLKKNPSAKVATDVLAEEVTNRVNSPLLKYAQTSRQVVITQHIGGMSREAQEIAYGHAVSKLKLFFDMVL